MMIKELVSAQREKERQKVYDVIATLRRELQIALKSESIMKSIVVHDGVTQYTASPVGKCFHRFCAALGIRDVVRVHFYHLESLSGLRADGFFGISLWEAVLYKTTVSIATRWVADVMTSPMRNAEIIDAV